MTARELDFAALQAPAIARSSFKNVGRELRPKGEPEQVLVHDFLIRELGRVSPYGVYDLAQNEAWVSVGIDHDTAAFAVESIRRWWWSMGHPL